MRSTFGASTEIVTECTSKPTVRSRATSSCQVEQIADHAVELARVRRDPSGQLADLLPSELDLVALQGDREADDRGERRAQIVRDGLGERVLHVVHRTQSLRRVTLPAQRVVQLFLGPFKSVMSM
jgi:hypothetical protein